MVDLVFAVSVNKTSDDATTDSLVLTANIPTELQGELPTKAPE